MKIRTLTSVCSIPVSACWLAAQKSSWRPEMWLFGLFPLRSVPNSLFSFLFIQRRRDINGLLPPSVCDRSFCVQPAKRIHSRRPPRPLHSLSISAMVIVRSPPSSLSAQQLRWECRAAARGQPSLPPRLIDSRGSHSIALTIYHSEPRSCSA